MMARKRKDEVVEEDSVTLEYTGEPAEVIPIPNAPVEEPTIVEAKEEIATPAVYVQQKFNI